MDAQTPLLWHIPLSHYSEKVRWALDYKGIAHRRQTLGLDYLFRTWRASRGKMPVLWLDGRAIGDSTHIIAALEQRFPEPALYPRDAEARERALAIEDDLDETLGPALRAAIVTPLFQNDPDIAIRLLTTAWPKAYRRIQPLKRIFPAYYRFRHRIRPADLERDRATVAAALDRIEEYRQGRTYLVGDAFTVADLTAAALLGALLRPPELHYKQGAELPPYLQSYRDAIAAHPAAQWAMGLYRRHRGASAEIVREGAPAPTAAVQVRHPGAAHKVDTV